MSRSSASDRKDIKKEKKKSLYLHELSSLIQRLAEDEPDVASVYITRVELSADSGICYIYFSSYPQEGLSAQELFEKALSILKLYKPSLRKALAQRVKARYVPNLIFLYDEKKDKVSKVEQLLDKVQQELRENEEPAQKEK